MIHIKQLYPQLGNSLFQLFCAIDLSESYQDKINFPKWKYAEYFEGDFKQDCIQDWHPDKLTATIYQEDQSKYQAIPYIRNLMIDGYWQNYNYFKNSWKLIQKNFTLKKEFQYEVSNEVINVSLHVRRGDYLTLSDHFVTQDIDYYNRAVELIRSKFPNDLIAIHILSDDPQWCEDTFPKKHVGKIKFFHDSSDDIVKDFAHMIACDHNIIANSSFSWAAALLNPNPNKIIVAPRGWFCDKINHFNSDFGMKDKWTRI